MKIYTIQHDKKDWDCYMGHVIVANNHEEVRKLAKDIAEDEGVEIWNDAIIEECGEYTSQRNEPFILMSDFKNG
ncbi:hypothetical protein [Epilithonimonas sp.]|uniref:hypothetical protein n=1 Tax=Epilithonimonas sp. TaxID=2894511 RepID=UPI0035B08C6F